MRILIVRHGEPDYVHDTLTEKGIREAKLLANRLSKEDIKAFYVSPLGRAQKTASYTLEKMGHTAETKEWLKEFDSRIQRPDVSPEYCEAWDWHPEDWTQYEEFFDISKWGENPIMKKGKVKERYEWVTSHLDALLAEYGYEYNGRYYNVRKENHDTIVFFCHFGLECVLLSHLLGLPVVPFWHGFSAYPTSVTEVYTQECTQGHANFRVTMFGDVSHLILGGEEPSFMGRHCECFTDLTEH